MRPIAVLVLVHGTCGRWLIVLLLRGVLQGVPDALALQMLGDLRMRELELVLTVVLRLVVVAVLVVLGVGQLAWVDCPHDHGWVLLHLLD